MTFDIDAAIKKQLDKVPDNHTLAVVLSGEKVAGDNARARLAVVLTRDGGEGEWNISTKAYVEVAQHEKPTIGAQLILSR